MRGEGETGYAARLSHDQCAVRAEGKRELDPIPAGAKHQAPVLTLRKLYFRGPLRHRGCPVAEVAGFPGDHPGEAPLNGVASHVAQAEFPHVKGADRDGLWGNGRGFRGSCRCRSCPSRGVEATPSPRRKARSGARSRGLPAPPAAGGFWFISQPDRRAPIRVGRETIVFSRPDDSFPSISPGEPRTEDHSLIVGCMSDGMIVSRPNDLTIAWRINVLIWRTEVRDPVKSPGGCLT